MKFPKAVFALVLIAVFSISLAAQKKELPGGFEFDNGDDMLYQIRTNPDLLPSQVQEYGSYQGVGLAVKIFDNIFALVIVNAQPDKGELIFKKQKKAPITLNVDGEKIMGGSYREVESKKVGTMKYEAIIVQIEREDFEKLLAANKINIDFGKFNHLVSAENLKAFHYLSERLEKDELPSIMLSGPREISSPTEIQVRGYYRRDGIYVRPHIRRRPRN